MTIDRRRFITITAASLSGAVLSGCNANPDKPKKLLGVIADKNQLLEQGLVRHSAMNRVASSAGVAGNSFPKYFISERVPVWNTAMNGIWRLEVSGAVRTPLSLTLDDLQKLPRVTQKVDHFCVEGWNARAVWSGVRVSELAKMAGVTGDAHFVDFTSFDKGYHESWDMESAMHPQTLIAYGMDGHLLGADHGAPARLHSPIKLGYKNTKYLTKVVFMPQQNGGYWSDEGYEWFGGT